MNRTHTLVTMAVLTMDKLPNQTSLITTMLKVMNIEKTALMTTMHWEQARRFLLTQHAVSMAPRRPIGKPHGLQETHPKNDHESHDHAQYRRWLMSVHWL